jgi:putative DNA primase/helicase
MSARIPAQVVNELNARVDIVELIGSRVELKKTGREFRGCCPFHTDNTPSFYVIPAKQFFNCFGCGAHGNAVSFLMQYEQLSFPAAVEALGATLGTGVVSEGSHAARREAVSTRTPVTEPPLDWSALAEEIWRRTQGLAGTLGETYLWYRGCKTPPRDSHLRFLPSDDRFPPSLCAAVSDVQSGEPISLHFTRLAPDGRGKAGTDRDKLLLGGHRKRGGCIRLWPDECVTQGLALAEGIESALAASHVFTPTWAAIDAGNLAGFPVIVGVESLTIFADNDEAGLLAARRCAVRWKVAGRLARILAPIVPGNDCADVVAA